MRIFIDTNTGTWGDAYGIVFLSESDSEIFVEDVEDRSDREIINFGNENGDAPLLSDF